MGIISHFIEFLGFLKGPKINYKQDQPLNFLVVTKLYFLVFAIELLIFIPISALIGLESLPHAMETVLETYTKLQVFILAVIVAPIAEELLFRFHLRYRPLIFLFLIITLTSFNYLLVGDSIEIDNHELLHDPSLILEPLSRYVPYIGLMMLVYLLYLVIGRLRSGINNLITLEFGFVFYVTATVFALVHIFNFETGTLPWYLMPLLVAPQFILALYLGYVRVRNNIFFSIYVHMLNNAIPIFLITLSSMVENGVK